MKRGIVYACSNQRWMAETMRSAESCRRHMPDLARELYVTETLLKEAGEKIREPFTEVVVLAETTHPHRPRFEATLQTTLDQAVFIDGDTLFLSPVYELFDLLENFDIAASLAPQYLSPRAIAAGVFDLMPKVSQAQPEWNTGVIVARVDAAFRAMVREWSALFSKCRAVPFGMDQASFRSAATHSRLRIATLPNNYNFRANIENSLAGAVKILHAHGDLEKIAGHVNSTLSMRVYRPVPGEIDGFQPKPVRPA